MAKRDHRQAPILAPEVFLVHRHRGDVVHCAVEYGYRRSVAAARAWVARRGEAKEDEIWTAEVCFADTGELVWSDMYGDLGWMTPGGPSAPGWYYWQEAVYPAAGAWVLAHGGSGGATAVQDVAGGTGGAKPQPRQQSDPASE